MRDHYRPPFPALPVGSRVTDEQLLTLLGAVKTAIGTIGVYGANTSCVFEFA